jgi:hypothetical protein
MLAWISNIDLAGSGVAAAEPTEGVLLRWMKR